VEIVSVEGENWIGCGMTYTLFECVKEHLLDDLKEMWENEKLEETTEGIKTIQLAQSQTDTTSTTAPTVKKEQLTKSQKRRLWDKTDSSGMRPRGWNWVDIIRHLSQTGGSTADSSKPSS
jgi:hypothetical protein